jgi:hypothetical protein
MILSKIQLVSLAGSILFLLIILWSVRQKRLKEAYALLWLLSGIGLVVISIWMNILRVVSQWIGIVYPPMTLYLFMFMGITLILFQYSLVLSKNQERISRLTQELALLRQELEKLRKDQ